MPRTTSWNEGESVIYRGNTYSFPGEICAITTDNQIVVKAYGDSEGHYAGMKHIYGAAQLERYEMSDSKGSPFLVIDPERELIAQVRAFCELHPEKSPLGLAQLHAFLAMVDGGPAKTDERVTALLATIDHAMDVQGSEAWGSGARRRVADAADMLRQSLPRDVATPFLTQDGNAIDRYDPEICLGVGAPDGRHSWLVDGITEIATCDYCGQDKPT